VETVPTPGKNPLKIGSFLKKAVLTGIKPCNLAGFKRVGRSEYRSVSFIGSPPTGSHADLISKWGFKFIIFEKWM